MMMLSRAGDYGRVFWIEIVRIAVRAGMVFRIGL